ncbi:hypothetical protein A2641_03505 [Candidatus Nomurabacteria bacterium RIFCSPHIGHO2_01_FULL_37_25]|uniref:Laccase domain-containing protein n=1 Tax=Candidatus Nomurabacteria bacterium RIFCSPLOWO2_01_FULL_36_16 TaxID=1801767 RepID=A0A1F6WZS0_9BACT|nr:MAG: hypothetical protein A2641_03505 [Candidatus Nomurabacteria bacterium RIFCSPHIGHO2_01_FULL_37_25]OGI75555.1 MAG: hypothetical protein A3D36_03150 [Candidatus Nomurabacteria bacterium RIFCSPHIGHO2_02_FULL_36_29]OGI87393.1 MAG: hypothetical protein A3A91_02770 [Candidatus Nomurabacteria bacterium RIFCSPLOWO2_01_FULL_36_16]OGI96871.1 MAG: hypothetical protein A3I84_03085 [Candidatus Nomurabacteria bacterium RIFCSPLOWO2_02_FULL_36_8]
MEQNKNIPNFSENAVITIYASLKDIENEIILPTQVHGNNIIEIITGGEKLASCDALITQNRKFSLGIKTADCATVCFTDGKKIGIAHIGWRGLCLSLIEKMLTHFDFQNLNVFVGPFMHSFEIKKDFCFTQIQEKFGDKCFIEKKDKIIFLFKDAIMSLLPQNTQIDDRDTFEDSSLPSFRRDKTKERLVTVISFK